MKKKKEYLLEVHRLGGGFEVLYNTAHGLGDHSHPHRRLHSPRHRIDTRREPQVVPARPCLCVVRYCEEGAHAHMLAPPCTTRSTAYGDEEGARTGIGSSHEWHFRRRCAHHPCCPSGSPVVAVNTSACKDAEEDQMKGRVQV